MQAVWARLCTEEEKLQGLSSAKYYSYLSVIVRNTFLSLSRKKKSADYGPCFCCSQNTKRGPDSLNFTNLCQLMTNISEPEKEVLERKYFLQETDVEIASAMGICDICERKLFSRARKAFLSTLRSVNGADGLIK